MAVRKGRNVAVGLAGALLLAGCGGDNDSSSATPSTPENSSSGATTNPPESSSDTTSALQSTSGSAPATASPAQFDTTATLRVGMQNGSGPFDPHKGASIGVQYPYITPLYDRLVQVATDLSVEPMIATSWEPNDDFTVWTFSLRDDVEFHSGAVLDAAAVAANLNHARTQEGVPAATMGANIADVQALDPTTVEVTLSASDPIFVNRLATQTMLSSIVDPAMLGSPDLASTSAGSGPFELAAVAQDRITYHRADSYWDPDVFGRLPETVEIVILPDDQARLNALQTDAIDAMFVMSEISNLDELTDSGEFVRYDFENTQRQHVLAINRNNPQLAKTEVQEAISFAIDRAGIGESVLWGSCAANAQPFGPGTPGYVEGLEPVFDPDRSTGLLQGAGADGLEVSLLIAAFGAAQPIAEAVQANLAAVGINAEIEAVEPQLLISTWAAGGHDLALVLYGGQADPLIHVGDEFFAAPLSQGPVPVDMQAVYDAVKVLPPGADGRLEALEALSNSIVEQPINVPICSQNTVVVARSTVLGVKDQPGPSMNVVFDIVDLGVAAS